MSRHEEEEGGGHSVVEREMEIFENKGVDQSTDSVEFLSFHNNSDSEVEVNEEASVGEESNTRWAALQTIVPYISPFIMS